MSVQHDAALAMPESTVTPEVAAIFAEIRTATRAPFVTSVWRVLAEDEATLRATWAATMPYIDPDATSNALSGITLPRVAAVIGSDAAASVVRTYTTVNAGVMRGLAGALRGSAPTEALRAGTRPTRPTPLPRTAQQDLPADGVSIPRLLERSALHGGDLAAIDRIDQTGAASGTAPLHATIWRHLASAAPGVAAELASAMSAIAPADIDRVTRAVIAALTHGPPHGSGSSVPDNIRPYLHYYATDAHVTPRVVALGLIAGRMLTGVA